MSNLQAAVRAFATDGAQPAELCQQVNRILCGRIAEGRFISFFYCKIDTALGVLTYSNAGHYLPVIVHADGTTCRLSEGGPVLGVFADATYEQAHVQIAPGRPDHPVHRRRHRGADTDATRSTARTG